MSFGSGFIIGQMLGNSNSSCQKHALEQENYELKRKNDELVQKNAHTGTAVARSQ